MTEETLVSKRLCEKDIEAVLDLDNENRYAFNKVFKFGVDTYIQGDWKTARRVFERCFSLRSDDGPTKTLYNFMKSFGFEKPSNWNRCRELTEK